MRDRFLRAIAMFTAAANLAYAGTTTLAIVFLVRIAGFGPTAVGLLVATGGAGAIVGAIVIRPLAQRLGTARALTLAALGSGLAGLLLPLTRPGPAVAFYIIGAAVTSAGTAGGSVIIVSFRQAYCPPLMLGRIITSQRILAYGTIPLGALLAGGLSTAVGVRDALWVILAIYALSGNLLLTRTIQANRNLPAAVEQIDPAPKLNNARRSWWSSAVGALISRKQKVPVGAAVALTMALAAVAPVCISRPRVRAQDAEQEQPLQDRQVSPHPLELGVPLRITSPQPGILLRQPPASSDS